MGFTRQETRDKLQATRDKRQEARGKGFQMADFRFQKVENQYAKDMNCVSARRDEIYHTNWLDAQQPLRY
jgi:hypothetical protein